jgi:hypothetical protein
VGVLAFLNFKVAFMFQYYRYEYLRFGIGRYSLHDNGPYRDCMTCIFNLLFWIFS